MRGRCSWKWYIVAAAPLFFSHISAALFQAARIIVRRKALHAPMCARPPNLLVRQSARGARPSALASGPRYGHCAGRVTAYWEELRKRRAQLFAEENSLDAVPLSASDQAGISELLTRRDDMRAAFAACAQRPAVNKLPTTVDSAAAGAAPEPAAVVASTGTRDEVRRVAWQWAAHYLRLGHPLLAASVLLAAGETAATVEELVRAGEPEIAYAVAMSLGLNEVRPLEYLAQRAEHYGMWYVTSRLCVCFVLTEH